MTECLTDGEKGGFRVGRGFVDQIFTQKQIGEKAREKYAEYVGFMDLENPCDRPIRKHYTKCCECMIWVVNC